VIVSRQRRINIEDQRSRAAAYLSRSRYEQFGARGLKISAARSAVTLRAKSTASVA
jgi:hypothetical protein